MKIKIVIVLILTAIFLLGIYLNLGRLNQPEDAAESQPVSPQVDNPPVRPLPGFEVLERKVNDNPEKTEVDLSIYVKDDLSRESLSHLIDALYTKESDSKEYKHRIHPSHIRISAYTSTKAFKKENWVAQFTRLGEHLPPYTEFKEKPSARLDIQTRKKIHSEINMVRKVAYKAAEKKYPSPEDLDKQIAFMDQEIKRREDEIMKKYNISDTELNNISNDWTLRSWENK